jgi:hypothetical protein
MRQLLALSVALALVTGCRFGPKLETVSLARAPRGTMMEVMRVSGSTNGELLAVAEDGLVILEGRRMVNVPFVEIREARSSELGREYRFSGQKRPSPDVIARLRRVSHFPQGITPEIEAKLLTIYER